MQIIWHGQSCFEIITNSGKNQQTRIVIDPFDESLGLRIPKLEADILLVTCNCSDHNNIKAVSGSSSINSANTPFMIEGPGEYEIKGIYIQGISVFPKSNKEKIPVTVYTLEAEEGIKLCHLGELVQAELTDGQIDLIGNVDVLMIPIGGSETISAAGAVKVINQIEPKLVIPMHYDLPKLKMKLDGVEKFLKTMGAKKIEPQNKLTLKKKDLETEGTKVVVLEP